MVSLETLLEDKKKFEQEIQRLQSAEESSRSRKYCAIGALQYVNELIADFQTPQNDSNDPQA